MSCRTLLPIDIQYLGEHYVRGAGYAAILRLPVYGLMMEYYRSGLYEDAPSVDELIREAQQAIARRSSGIEKLLA